LRFDFCAGVVFAALINNRFDADPKKWRFISALVQDVSTLIEILTPLVRNIPNNDATIELSIA
jgi:hypothetical protein